MTFPVIVVMKRVCPVGFGLIFLFLADGSHTSFAIPPAAHLLSHLFSFVCNSNSYSPQIPSFLVTSASGCVCFCDWCGS